MYPCRRLEADLILYHYNLMGAGRLGFCRNTFLVAIDAKITWISWKGDLAWQESIKGGKKRVLGCC
jgi:hypothetical protein